MIDDFVEGDPFDPEVAARAEQVQRERVKQADDAVAAHMRRTVQVYKRTFQEGNATPDDLDFLMRDLAFFVRADEDFFPDTRLQDVMIGRRQVLRRIVEYTSLDFNALVKRYIETQN